MPKKPDLTVLKKVLYLLNTGMERVQCPICHKHPVAINYRRGDKVYYHKACTPCVRRKRKPAKVVAGWIKSGYKKRDRCERCSFKFKLSEQGKVYHVDGNIKNTHWANLRTVCLNCQPELAKTNWRPGDLQPDF